MEDTERERETVNVKDPIEDECAALLMNHTHNISVCTQYIYARMTYETHQGTEAWAKPLQIF